MGIASNLNKGNRFDYELHDGMTYKNLEQLVKENGIDFVYGVHMIYINKKSRYGDNPVLVTDEYLVNAPKHMIDVCNEILNKEEYVNAINNNELGFRIYQYSKENKTYYSVEWVDL